MAVNVMWVPPGVPPAPPTTSITTPAPTPAPSCPPSRTPSRAASRAASVAPVPASRPSSASVPPRERNRAASLAPHMPHTRPATPYAGHSPAPTPTPFTSASSAMPSRPPAAGPSTLLHPRADLPRKPSWAVAPPLAPSRNDSLPNKPSVPTMVPPDLPCRPPGRSGSSSDQEGVDAALQAVSPDGDGALRHAVSLRVAEKSGANRGAEDGGSNQSMEEGGHERKRKRSSSPPFEWQPEPEEEPEPAGFFDLASARVVEVQVPTEKPTFLSLPLPSKRSKTRVGARAVLIPVEHLPVFPLPPLPPIHDEELLKQVFTHASLFERDNRLFEYADDKPARHYEKLEHVGDSILGMVVTAWLHEMQPHLTCGTATKLKAHLVSNATLSHISGMYNFPARLNGDPRLLPVLRAQTDVRAAIVEAYIAALYFSHPPETRDTVGLATVKAWLREMLDPLYDFFLTFMRIEYQQHYSAMGAGLEGILEMASSPEALEKMDQAAEGMALLVNTWAKVRERRIEWDCQRHLTGVGELWRMRVYVDGVLMGDAVRAFVQRAKNAAGLQAARKLGLAEPL